MIASLVLVLASLAVLTIGAEFLVRGAVMVARRLRLSSFFIGLTIVGFGTSTPELFTSLIATLQGRDDISVGNVVGSNIFNIAAILGLTALVKPILVRFEVVRGQTWIVVAASCAPFLALAAGGTLNRPMGALLVASLGVYLWHGYRQGRREGDAAVEAESELEHEVIGGLRYPWKGAAASVLFIALGLALLVGGSKLLVDAASDLARAFGVSELVIALTIVAGGTSAPELFTSMVAALRGQADLAVGNILGSNVFNIAGILGLSALVHPQTINPQVLVFDAPVMLGLSVLLIPILAAGSSLSRRAGAFLLASYAAYLFVLLTWAPARFAG